jgi:DNA-directed RNA polymerase subunit RPC12/RpoP
MGRCNKCGKIISSRLGTLCMKCRYENNRSAPSVRKKITGKRLIQCPVCKKMFFTSHSKQKYCSEECKRKHRVRARSNNASKVRTLTDGICVECGKHFPAGYKPTEAKCPECRKKPTKIVAPPHVDSPTRPVMIRPGGWTGAITKEPDKPVKAKIRIPVSRMPDRGRPTKDRAYERQSEEEIKKEIAQAEFGNLLW